MFKREPVKNFNCSYCESLKTLKGAPKKVGGDFDCTCYKTHWEIKEIVKISKVLGNIYIKYENIK